jgi:hypothetical protein
MVQGWADMLCLGPYLTVKFASSSEPESKYKKINKPKESKTKELLYKGNLKVIQNCLM